MSPNRALRRNTDVQIEAASRNGYLPLMNIVRLHQFRAHVDEAKHFVKQSVRRDESPRIQLPVGEDGPEENPFAASSLKPIKGIQSSFDKKCKRPGRPKRVRPR